MWTLKLIVYPERFKERKQYVCKLPVLKIAVAKGDVISLIPGARKVDGGHWLLKVVL